MGIYCNIRLYWLVIKIVSNKVVKIVWNSINVFANARDSESNLNLADDHYQTELSANICFQSRATTFDNYCPTNIVQTYTHK